jgi:hypothetical protein
MFSCLYKGVFQYLADGWDLDLFSLGQLCCCCFTRDRGPRLLRGLAARRCWRSPFRLGSVLVFALAVVLCATW